MPVQSHHRLRLFSGVDREEERLVDESDRMGVSSGTPLMMGCQVCDASDRRACEYMTKPGGEGGGRNGVTPETVVGLDM